MIDEIHVAGFSAWAPGFGSINEGKAWDEWAQGQREMQPSSESPEIAFTDSMFRRRLSQISKMTIQVVNELLSLKEDSIK
jgi:hypothetical protein